MPSVSYDSRSLLIDGQRKLIVSGAVHYPRSTPSMWPQIIQRSKAAGLNTIETYVFWNLHERRRGVMDFSDRLDLYRFCQIAHEQGMHVILRIGPYICAETNFGGLPPWLREVPGMQIRTWNEPFMREKERFVRVLCQTLRPLFAPRGGPIVMAQIENEYNNISKSYGQEGQNYLKWCVQLGNSLDLGIPWVQCFGAAEGAIESINGFYGHTELEKHFKEHPEQPPLWTENWPGWYDTWGFNHHGRTPENVAYGVARFFAAGGAGVNYYMWQGGTNFDRETMYSQTTSYDFDGPLDEFGHETTKSRHLTRLHRILIDHADQLFATPPATPTANGAQVEFSYGSLVFRCDDEAKSVQIFSGGKLLMDTAVVEEASRIVRTTTPAGVNFSPWQSLSEPLPGQWPADLRTSVESKDPIEQLSLTHDLTDYCWYSTTLESSGPGELMLDGVADVVHVFVDGRLATSSTGAPQENRDIAKPEEWRQTFKLDLPAGRRRIDLLCCAIGLVKGDWMLGMQNMMLERKGLFGRALWNGSPLPGPWSMQSGLLGERLGTFDPARASTLKWEPAPAQPAAPRWWKSNFARPSGDAPLVVDLTGLNKGLAWLNGRCIGRYWLIRNSGVNLQGPTFYKAPITNSRAGEPSQHLYHLPLEWLQNTNTLVLLEETEARPDQAKLLRRN